MLTVHVSYEHYLLQFAVWQIVAACNTPTGEAALQMLDPLLLWLSQAKNTCLLPLLSARPASVHQVWLLDAQDPQALPVCVQQRTPGLEYFVEHHHGHLLLLTNKSTSDMIATDNCSKSSKSGPSASQQQQSHSKVSQAGSKGIQSPQVLFASDAAAGRDNSCFEREYSLMTTPTAAITSDKQHSMNSWPLLVPERAGVVITDMDVFDGWVLLHELNNARPCMTLLRISQAEQQTGPAVLQQQQVRPTGC